jgi:hypothetical protein
MQSAETLTVARKLVAIVAVLLWLEVLLAPADAQTAPGYNAICNSGSGCSTAPTPAFIDASALGGTNKDICAVLYGILSNSSTQYPASGAVIDARGLPGTLGTKMVCASGTTPWFNGTTFANVPSTILLPAGIITIPSTWVLPSGTKLIGEGSRIPPFPVSPPIPGTTMIQACTNSITGCPATNFSGAMIEFGAGCPGTQCTGPESRVSVEDLVLNGNGLGVTGILNGEAEELSYVDHVALIQILGIGLNIISNAENSGPYTNITFDTGAYAPGTSTSCAQILSVFGGTRGIHGLTCIGEQGNGNNAVLLDSSNNSLEDVRVIGFDNGIIVGSQYPAHSNVLLNIYGDTPEPPVGGTVINVIEISTNYPVTDLSIMGVANAAAVTGANTIADLATGTTLADASVGIYALGQPQSGGHTRFTTSPNATTWVMGNPTNAAAPTGSCATGSLYSNVSTVNTGHVLYVCAVGSTPSWKPVK